MSIRPFQLERYLDRYEFTTPLNLSCSACETVSIGELLALAGESLQSLSALRLGYTETQGDPALRESISSFYQEASAGDVIVTNAPEEGIFLAMETLLEPGDRVVVQTPCYQSLIELARHKGCDVQPWTVQESSAGWRLDLDNLDALLAGARLLVVNFPHNPTGLLPTKEEFHSIFQKAERAGARLFSDEMYRGLEPLPEQRLPAGTDLHPGVVSLWGMSKTFGLPGLRIGWLVTRDADLRERILSFKDYTTICSSAPGELLARIALDAADCLMERGLGLIRDNLALTQSFMETWKQTFRWQDPQAGPVTLARLQTGSAERFCDLAREEAGVLLVPSSVFDFGDRHIRLGLGRASYPQGLQALETWLRSRSAPS
jgi:aspartate/methionine/tyrosine aminotransferase